MDKSAHWSTMILREVVQDWLTGVNPELGDRIPLRLLREADLNILGPEIMAAARAFIAGG